MQHPRALQLVGGTDASWLQGAAEAGQGWGWAPLSPPCARGDGVSGEDRGLWEVHLQLFPSWVFWCLQRRWVQGEGTPRLALEATQPLLCQRWWAPGA